VAWGGFFVVMLWWNVWSTWTVDGTFLTAENLQFSQGYFGWTSLGTADGRTDRASRLPHPSQSHREGMGHPVAVKAQTEIEATEPLIRVERIGRHGDP